MKTINIGVTGHREGILNYLKLSKNEIFKALDNIMSKIVDNNRKLKNPKIIFHNGFFNGTDQIISEYCIINNISYLLYIPLALNEKYTDEEIKNKKIKNREDFYKEFHPYLSSEISEINFEIYKNKLSKIKGVNIGFMERNLEIVKNSDKIICLFSEKIGIGGGTHQTLDFAKEQGLEIFNILDYVKDK